MRLVKRWLMMVAVVACLGVLVTGCDNGSEQMSDDPSRIFNPEGAVAYASYSNGDDTLHFLDPQTLASRGVVQLGKGYGNSIYKDPHGRIWVPLTMTPSGSYNTHVAIFDPKSRHLTTLEVGGNPSQVFFQGETAYVFCEDHELTVYKVDANWKVTKWKTMGEASHGDEVVTDGANFYAMSTAGHILKITPSGTVTTYNINHRYSTLFFVNDHLYAGVSGDPAAQLAELDTSTMLPKTTLSTSNLDGQLMQIDEHTLAAVQHIGHAAVSLYDVGTQKVLAQFEIESDIDHLTRIGGNLYSVDNRIQKIALTSLNGQPIKEIDAPTMVTNFIK